MTGPERIVGVGIIATFACLDVVYRIVFRKPLRHWLGISKPTP